MFLLFAVFPLLLASRCGHDDFIAHYDPLIRSSKPLVSILPIQNEAVISETVGEIFSKTLLSRLQSQRNFLLETGKSGRSQFFVQLQFIDLQDTNQPPSDFILSVHLKIFENSSEKPKLILQEVFTTKTLLEDHNNDASKDDFEITPLGLAGAKLSREIAGRIEEVIVSKLRSG